MATKILTPQDYLNLGAEIKNLLCSLKNGSAGPSHVLIQHHKELHSHIRNIIAYASCRFMAYPIHKKYSSALILRQVR